MELTREFNLLQSSLSFADRQFPGGLKEYKTNTSNEPIEVVKETVFDLLNGCNDGNAIRDKTEQIILSCLLAQYVQPQEADEKYPFVGMLPEMSSTFLLELVKTCHLEESLVKVLCRFTTTAALRKLRGDLVQYMTANQDPSDLPMLFRAIHPLLTRVYLGPMAEVLLTDLQGCLEKNVTDSMQIDQNGILGVCLGLCCLLEKCIFIKGDKVLEMDNRLDAVYTGLQCLHYGWARPIPEVNKDVWKSGPVIRLVDLMRDNMKSFNEVCNSEPSLEDMKNVCKSLPGRTNSYYVAIVLTNMLAALNNAEEFMGNSVKDVKLSTEKLHKFWVHHLLKQTETVYKDSDMLNNIAMILDNKLPHCQQVLTEMVKVQENDIKADSRWVDLLERNSNLLGNVDHLKSLLQRLASIKVLDEKVGARVDTVCRKLFNKLSTPKKDEVILYTLENEIRISAQDGDFNNAATLVFNKLSSKDASKSDAAWLALCNPESFVKFAVENSVKYSGQGKVIADLLNSMPSVCKYNNHLTEEVKNVIQVSLSEKQQKNLVQFILHLFSTKGAFAVSIKQFSDSVIYPLVNIHQIKSSSGLPFPYVVEILNLLINASSKRGVEKFPSDDEMAPLVLCLADVLDYCSVLWAEDRNGSELVMAKEIAQSCLRNLLSGQKLLKTDMHYLKRYISDHCDTVKLFIKSQLTESRVLMARKELSKNSGHSSVDKLSRLQMHLQILMLLDPSEMKELEFSVDGVIDYSLLVLVLAAILPHYISQEWCQCTTALKYFSDNSFIVLPSNLDVSTASSVVSQILLDVMQVLTSSLHDTTYYPAMLNHVTKCYAVAIKELTILQGVKEDIGNLATILGHICLLLYRLPAEVSDPLLVVALNTLQLIQEKVTQSTANYNVEEKLQPMLNVLKVLGGREDANVLNKKLKMFLKLYA